MDAMLRDALVEATSKDSRSLESLLFVFSGAKDKQQLEDYTSKMALLEKSAHSQLRPVDGDSEILLGMALANFLWSSYPKRYNQDWKLTQVVDNWFSNSNTVGNCQGMTALFTIMAVRFHIPVKLGYVTPGTYLDQGHVFNKFVGDKNFAIDHTATPWFLENHLASVEEDINKLVPMYLISEDLHLAPDDKLTVCNYAIELWPENYKAFANRAAIYLVRGDLKQALVDYDKAILLNQNCAAAFLRRGQVYSILRNFDKAKQDYDCAIHVLDRLVALDGSKESLANYSERKGNSRFWAVTFLERAIAKAYLGLSDNGTKDIDTALALDQKVTIGALKDHHAKFQDLPISFELDEL